jgi:hypothetical protein
MITGHRVAVAAKAICTHMYRRQQNGNPMFNAVCRQGVLQKYG